MSSKHREKERTCQEKVKQLQVVCRSPLLATNADDVHFSNNGTRSRFPSGSEKCFHSTHFRSLLGVTMALVLVQTKTRDEMTRLHNDWKRKVAFPRVPAFPNRAGLMSSAQIIRTSEATTRLARNRGFDRSIDRFKLTLANCKQAETTPTISPDWQSSSTCSLARLCQTKDAKEDKCSSYITECCREEIN